MILIFKFAPLVINRVDAKPFFLRYKSFLNFRVRRHSKNIQITEIIIPAFNFTCAPCTSAKREVCKYPSVRRNIELRPIMTACIVVCRIQPRLPACRDTGHSAKCDKEKSLYTAVSFQIDCTVFRNALNCKIFSHKRIHDLCRHKIVKSACQNDRIRLITGQFIPQFP